MNEKRDENLKKRKKPKLTLLQILFLVGAAGVALTVAYQHGAF